MNKTERQMSEILRVGKENYGIVSVKADGKIDSLTSADGSGGVPR